MASTDTATAAEITQIVEDICLAIRHWRVLTDSTDADSVVSVIRAETAKQADVLSSGSPTDGRDAYLSSLLSAGRDQIDQVGSCADPLIDGVKTYVESEVKLVIKSTWQKCEDIMNLGLAAAMNSCATPQTINENTTAIANIAAASGNTGNGTLVASGTTQFCRPDYFRCVAISSGSWEVISHLSGALSLHATTGETFTDETAGISFEITEGSTPFAADDEIYFDTTSDEAGKIQSGLRDLLGVVLPSSGSPTIPDSLVE